MSSKNLIGQRIVMDGDWPAYLVAFFGDQQDGRVVWIDFKAWRVQGDGDDDWILDTSSPDGGRVLKAEWFSGVVPEFGPERDEIDVLSGYIKWDGCSEWDIPRQHYCGVQTWRQQALLGETVWAFGREVMGDDCE